MFRTLATSVGGSIRWLPDGETGPDNWLMRFQRVFAEHPDFVQPDFRRNEMLGFIRGGLEDFSISR